MVDQSAETPIIRIGVQMIVRRGEDILLGRRKNTFQAGTWGLPGGLLKANQTIMQTAAKELREETGLIARKMRLFCVTDPLPGSNHHMQIGVEVLAYDGEPEIKEPEKCDALQFHPLDNLPAQLFVSSVGLIRNYRAGRFYCENTG